jgi:uncharacterized LabA/DUF88 family protein
LAETKLKIAVFIDFDNIEIGVKTTLGSHFDAGAVLEAIKERGEVVTKIAYGDWTRAGDYSRSLTQHAIHMVQRNLTPGGDKNGADINLALDALEMAFTHSHINTFVIVGGDSDFMALVEKLKQYDRKVLVVGGRAFTSHILQKNCHEFIAYENLIGRRGGARGRSPQEAPLAGAVTLVRRALKVLADREVSPQLGVLKSTLLQLDPTFSEREYGASTFRDLVQRLGRQGYVSLKGTDRNIYVELREGPDGTPAPAARGDGETTSDEGAEPASEAVADAELPATPAVERVVVSNAVAAAPAGTSGTSGAASASSQPPAAPSPQVAGQQLEGYRLIQDVFLRPGLVSRWPLYLRQVKQLLRSADESFDERKYGFSGMVEALRYGQREGLFRLDRDRQGVLRVYPGALLQRQAPAPAARGAGDGGAPREESPEVDASTAATASPIDESRDAIEAGAPLLELEAAAAGAPADRPEPEVARAPRRRSAAKKAAAPVRKPPKTRARNAPRARKAAKKSEGQ